LLFDAWPEEATVKKGEEAMEILQAYDVTGSLRGAAALAGCDHKSVARLVAARDAAGGAAGAGWAPAFGGSVRREDR
jgi:molybdenum-dependent DNA-binding transcriptional regulator ModE